MNKHLNTALMYYCFIMALVVLGSNILISLLFLAIAFSIYHSKNKDNVK